MHVHNSFNCIKAFLVFVICFFISSSVFARSDLIEKLPSGMYEYEPVIFDFNHTNSAACTLTCTPDPKNSEVCPRSKVSNWSCPYSYKAFVLDASNQPKLYSSECDAESQYWDTSQGRPMTSFQYLPDGTLEIGFSCVVKKCPKGYQLTDPPNGTIRGVQKYCSKPRPCPDGLVWSSNTLSCEIPMCPQGSYRPGGVGECTPLPECTVNETLEYNNGFAYCKPIECGINEFLENGVCKPIQCESNEDLIDGKCIKKTCEPDSKFYKLCQWYEDWKIWKDDYNWYESSKHQDNQIIKYTIDDIKQQDSSFYEEIREFINNNNGSPSTNFPVVQFPPFCEWSSVVCEWYLDYKEFTDDVREWMDEYGHEIDNNRDPLENNDQPYQITENDNVDLSTTRYFNNSESCPIDRVISLSLGGYTSEITISYRSLCDAAVMFKPFVILMSFMAGIFIITNTGRRAETGD